MKVEKVNLNKAGNFADSLTSATTQRVDLSKSAQDSVSFSSKPAFTGSVEKAVPQIIDSIPAKKAIQFMEKYFEPLRGEAGSILITAAGTGAVAPIFIAFNPFVKAPKDATPEQKKEVQNNKTYTALRQPISAVLAAVFQLGALNPIDKYLDKQFNQAENAKKFNVNIDQSVINNKSYLKTIIKKQMKEEGTVYESSRAFDAELKRRIEETSNKQVNALAKDIEKEGTIIISGRELPRENVVSIINNNIDNYVKAVNSHFVNEEGLKFYEKRAQVLVDNEAYLKEMFGQGKLPETSKMKSYISDLIKDAPNEDIKEILKEIQKYEPELMESRCQRTLERIAKIKRTCQGNYSPEAYKAYLEANNAIVTEFKQNLQGLKIADAENLSPEEFRKLVKETLGKLAETCTYDAKSTANRDRQIKNLFHDTETIQTNLGKMKEKVYKDVAKSYKTFLEHGYKGVNTVLKMLIGIFVTLPITCTALNWVYPRFMELFFPKLCGTKKEGGNK